MTKQTNNKAPSFLSLLTLLFIGLKLGSVISWSWFWVLAPTIIPLGFGVFFLIIFMIFLILTPKKSGNYIIKELKKLSK